MQTPESSAAILLPSECPNCGRLHEGHSFVTDPGPVQVEAERLRDALERIASGRVEQRGSLRPSFADASRVARAALEGDDDAAA